MRKQYGSHPNIELLDPIYDQGKLDMIRGNASLYVHGHSAGGTNPSLVEAMYLGLPVIAFSVSYNKTTTENKAWYFKEADDIVQIVETATPAERKEKAQIMKEIADAGTPRKVIAEKYTFLVNRVLVAKDKINVKSDFGDMNMNELINLEMGHLAYPSFFYEKR